MLSDDYVSLAELLSARVPLTIEDAVAIIAQLSEATVTGRPMATHVTAEHIWIGPTGSVRLSPGILPAVRDVGALLEQLLEGIRERQGGPLPRKLVFVIARATGQWDGASFPSLNTLAAALAPFTSPDRPAALRNVHALATRPPALRTPVAAPLPAPTEEPAVRPPEHPVPAPQPTFVAAPPAIRPRRRDVEPVAPVAPEPEPEWIAVSAHVAHEQPPVPEAFRDSVRDSFPDSLPDALPDSLPDSVRGSFSDSTLDADADPAGETTIMRTQPRRIRRSWWPRVAVAAGLAGVAALIGAGLAKNGRPEPAPAAETVVEVAPPEPVDRPEPVTPAPAATPAARDDAADEPRLSEADAPAIPETTNRADTAGTADAILDESTVAAAPMHAARAQPFVEPDRVEADAVFSPSFSPSGSAVFFHAQTEEGSALKRAERGESGELHVATIVDDGANNYHVQLSPDGRSVAFDSDRDGVRGVYVANADGTNVRRVSGPGYAAVPTWSPDGRRLAFVRAEFDRRAVWNLWVLDNATGASTRLTNHRFGQVWGGAWFPGGQRIAYSHEDRLIVRDLGTGRESIYPSPVKGRLVRTPAVAPDGRWIMFQVHRDGAWLLDVETGTRQKVLADPSAEEFTWAPDGRRVAFHSRRSGGWGLWMMTAP